MRLLAAIREVHVRWEGSGVLTWYCAEFLLEGSSRTPKRVNVFENRKGGSATLGGGEHRVPHNKNAFGILVFDLALDSMVSGPSVREGASLAAQWQRK